MLSDPERLKRNIQEAGTQDLLDRITAFRKGMEPEAVVMIEEELIKRGVDPEDVMNHWEEVKRDAIVLSDGMPARCSFCPRPAVAQRWGWHFSWGRILPVFRPRHYYYCAAHRPGCKESPEPGD
jgi:hypothetical protein